MITSNASPLIYLARIGSLPLLKALYTTVLIPEEVKKEVVDVGKAAGKQDAYHIEQAILDGWIQVRQAPAGRLPIDLHPGEAAAILLARSLNTTVLLDETKARLAAELLSLPVRGTVSVLLRAVKSGLLTFPEFLALMRALVGEGFRLKEEVFLGAVQKAEELAEQQKPLRKRS